MNFKNFEYVLALAHKPAGSRTVLDWRPFRKDTLNDIIDNHNSKCVRELEKTGWPPNYIEKYGQFISIANYDLSNLDRIELDRSPKIKLVLANLAEISGASPAAQQVGALMNRAGRVYHLAQISMRPPRPSERARFMPSPVLPSNPEVMDEQAQLEKWLATLFVYYAQAIRESVPPAPAPPLGGSGGLGGPEGAGGIRDSGWSPKVTDIERDADSWSDLYFGYRSKGLFDHIEGGERQARSLVDIASNVRDVAFQRQLSEEETRVLARKAMLQEEALGIVRAIVLKKLSKTGEGLVLVLDSLGKPIAEITANDEYRKTGVKGAKTEIMAIKLTKPVYALSKWESELCSGLGLKKDTSILLTGGSTIFEKIQGLTDAVETRQIKVDLPFDATDLFIK